MTKWKCVICARKMETDMKPSLNERLCADCSVRHWTKVVDIYRTVDVERLAEAKVKLRAAQKALEKSREVIQ